MSNQTLLTPHFTLLEFSESATAKKYGIANEPTPEVQENLMLLCRCTLEPLREALGMPIIITSGYRCKALNTIISHSSHRSQHLKGQAVDFYVGQGQISSSKFKVQSHRELLIKAFHLILTSEQIDYDQLILYPDFIHVSYVSPKANRHYIMTANGSGQYKRVSREVALSIL